jgi:hypothetical protein
VKYKGPKNVDSRMFDAYRHDDGLRLEWILDDSAKFSDAYLRKLRLEWKYGTRAHISAADLPVSVPVVDVNKTYRVYRKYIGRNISMEDIFTAGETYSPVSQWAHVVWRGLVTAEAYLRSVRVLGVRIGLEALFGYLVEVVSKKLCFHSARLPIRV